MLDSAHHSLSTRFMHTSKSLDKLNDNNHYNNGIDTTTLTNSKQPECWTIPEQVSSFEFTPKQFMEQGPGKEYLSLYQKQAEQNRRPVLKVRFALYYLLSTCQPVYYHIHKNGGTTMNIKDNPIVDAYYTPKEQTIGRKQFRNETIQILTDIYNYQIQKEQTATMNNAAANAVNKEMPFFTFLRDPVPRFLSGVGQAQKLNKLGPCYERQQQQVDALALLDCVLTQIKETESFLDEHLVPQAFELYHGVVGLDLKIQVMDISSLNTVLHHLGFGMGAGEAPKRRISRGRKALSFNITELTPSLMERICETYKVDVLLLRATGVSDSMCHLHTK